MSSRSYFPFFTVANRRQSKFPCHLKRIAALDTKFDKIAFSKENPATKRKAHVQHRTLKSRYVFDDLQQPSNEQDESSESEEWQRHH